ncbi:hypothetical protein [Clostridium sp. Ade.TY]|uniref:hypothetical protein n=1 Tax=Clostridium sp. Ade.TY TaxID=1391647 RepID=UPI0003FE985C|nr:hypothetical protein [Clostridium sp. Ade.TY]
MISIIYYVELLLILFLFLGIIKKFNRKLPIKIKVFFIIGMMGIFLRNLAILLMCIIKNSSIAYSLKGLLYLDYLIIPLIIIGIYYVYFRIEKFSFNKIYLFSIIFIALYVIFNKYSKGKIILNNTFGYTLKLYNNIYINLVFIIILILLLILGTLFLNKKNVLKSNLIELMIIVSLICIDIITIMIGINPIPYSIFGEALILISLNSCIKTFK